MMASSCVSGAFTTQCPMTFARKIILYAPPADSPHLAPFVEQCLQDSVVLIAVVGDNCNLVEDIIDELIIGDGSDEKRFILTTSHSDESFEAVFEFVSNWGNPEGEPQVIRL